MWTFLIPIFLVVLIAKLLPKWLSAQHHTHLPRGYSDKKFVSEKPSRAPKVQIHMDPYSSKKVPDDIDCIVIGSGIGGLTCAGMLSRAGKRCLVIEQHYIAGGCTHAFEDHGFEFDTGIHYIGNIERRKKYFDLVCENPIEWDQMGSKENKWLYDEFVIGGGDGSPEKKYNLRAGKDEYIRELVSHFPEERAAIERWVELITDVSKKDLFFDLKIARPVWLAKLLNRFHPKAKKFFKYNKLTALEMAQEVTSNVDLQAALLAQFGDYGQTPSTESFFMHASVANHYIGGGFYPHGGSTVIAKEMIPTIEATGGRVLVRKAVEEVLVEGGRAVGVRVSGGEVVRAAAVISACGVFNTWKNLVPRALTPERVFEKMDRIGHSCSFMYLFVGMKGSPESHNLRSSNIWVWPNRDYDAMIKDFNADPYKAPLPLFMGFPCAKDKTWNARFPGKSNAVIMSLADYRWFEKWEGTKHGKRGKEYEEFKEMFAQRILEEGMYKYYPQTRGSVEFTMVGSSLTFNHYIGSHRGEVYGLESHPERFDMDDWLRPQTHIPGLYLTGQDVTTLGVTGAMMGGILTSHAVLGYGNVVDILSGRNLVEDLWHLEAQQGKKKAN